jgi:Mg/Co/Ni transporter MgtE
MDALAAFRQLTRRRDYPALKSRLAEGDLADLEHVWEDLKPLEKLVYFKLLEPERAMEFYGRLDFHERYYLLTAFDLNSIAPVLEGLPEDARSLFVSLEPPYYNRMLQGLVHGEIQIPVSDLTN